ncbi:hypothetical protein QTO34_015486 [Cnephaeus nilssonii]|uniref:Uncharacterized protein n=1 Tax=Cnephaeus nilssonii TaxID=3371016 RepID=A0AA40LR84_CNENI|nr:hypothetical protein QTO34_015486 [Eptesicus nilssonii]
MRYHEMYTGEKPYECKQCEKTYSHPRSFKFSKALIVERNHSNARNMDAEKGDPRHVWPPPHQAPADFDQSF